MCNQRRLWIAGAIVMRLFASSADTGEIRFRLGLTRGIDACEDAGSLIRYRSGGARR